MAKWARTALVALALAAALAVAALALAGIYRGGLAARLFVGAAVVPVAVSLAARRLPAWTVAPLSVLALAGYTAEAVRVSAVSGGVPGGLLPLAEDALRNGIPRLLTATLPVEAQPDTVAVPVVSIWLAALAAGELALRAHRVLLAFAPAVALYAAALYVVGPNAGLVPWQPLCFAAAVALALAATVEGRAVPELTRAQRGTLRTRVALGTLTALAAVVGLVAAVGPGVAHRVEQRPTDPRRYVTPPRLDSLDENPLVRLSGWALNKDQPLMDVALSGGDGHDTRIRLGVLSDYDGVTWRVGATYHNAGRVLTAAADGSRRDPGAGTAVNQRITVRELDGRLLPAVAQPSRVDGVRVAYDQASGTLAVPSGLRPGLAYTVQSREPHTDPNLLPVADVPSGPPVARFLALGADVPPELQRLADQLSQGAAGAYQRAGAVEQFLGEHYQLVTDAPSGHAYPNLTFFLLGPHNAGGQRGTSEQFAASFAVLARIMGLPSRVVVGFHVRGDGTVRGADAYAWPEVLFTGLGWVPFDPLPQPNTTPRPVEDDFKPKPVTSVPPPSVAPTPSISIGPGRPRASHPAAPAAAEGPPVGTVLAGVGAGLFLAVVAFLVAVPLLRRAQRRRRLYRGDPPTRIAGAWRELLDGLRLAGRPPPPHLSASEVADHAARTVAPPPEPRRRGAVQLPAPSVSDLAVLVNAAGFAPDQPADGDARHAAAQAVAFVGELRARRPWWRRLLWTADPRPLTWGRRRS